MTKEDKAARATAGRCNTAGLSMVARELAHPCLVPEGDDSSLGVKGRGRRADEAIRLLRALWNGEPDFEGEFWSSPAAATGAVRRSR